MCNTERCLGEIHTFLLQGIDGDVGLVDIDDAVDVEGDLLGVGAPVLVAEAVAELAVLTGGEGVVAGRDGLFVELVLVHRIEDLYSHRGWPPPVLARHVASAQRGRGV